MFKKRGQITIFIIIGIILLLSFALFFYIRSLRVERVPVAPAIEEIPAALNPLKLFIDDCVESIALEGLIKLG